MNSRVSAYFSDDDLRKITEAVSDAERRTSAEIVPYIVDRSDCYDEAVWRAGLLSCIGSLGFFLFLRIWTDTWVDWGLPGVTGVVLFLSALSMILVRTIPFLTRLFAGGEMMHHRASQRAHQAFVSEEVFATRGRTGILMFVSLLEHVVIILGDSGISRKVPAEEWTRITRILIRSVREKEAGEGMIEAIQAGADLMNRYDIPGTWDDRNELNDEPRTGGPK